VLRDYRSAPIEEPLRATLAFLEAMTLRPQEVDASPALAAGVSRAALRDAVYVAAAFNLIDRFADAIGAKPHSEAGLTREQAIAHEARFFEEGYA
jgi:alkylhydroperoxidase family enzyme